MTQAWMYSSTHAWTYEHRGPGMYARPRARTMYTRARCWMCQYVIWSTFVLFLHHTSATQEVLLEYCQWETFNATCAEDEVIVLQSADYGRMELGRCLLEDYGHIGCRKDVLSYLDSRCSGRRKCLVSIPDPTLDQVHPCPGDLKAYLRASYMCVQVVQRDRHICRNSASVAVTSSSGYLASSVTADTQLGSSLCPWHIRAKPGQRVTVDLMDFSLWSDAQTGPADTQRHPPETSGICHIYASIREMTSVGSVTVCGGDKRVRTIYTSETDAIQIEVANMKLSRSPSHFLLKYDVLGCPIPAADASMSVEVQGSTAYLECRATNQKYTLTCHEDTWRGNWPNCTQVKTVGITDIIEGVISLPQGILIALIIGIALFIAVMILAIGLWTLRRRHYGRHAATKATLGGADPQYSRRSMVDLNKEHYPMLASQDRFPAEREGDYTSTWHRRAAMPASRIPASYFRTEDPNYRTGPARYPHDPGPPRCPQDPYAEDSRNAHTFNPPHVEHIYESPKFFRKSSNAEELSSSPFYHELDPDKLSDDEVGGSLTDRARRGYGPPAAYRSLAAPHGNRNNVIAHCPDVRPGELPESGRPSVVV